jgi:hypothetical protein
VDEIALTWRPVVKALSTLVIVCLVGGVAHAGGAATDAYADIDDVDLHGLADGYWLRNFDAPASGRSQLRAFDFDTGFALGYARLTLARRPKVVGFRIDAGLGNTADVFYRQDPAAARHARLARATSYLGQAFFTVVAPFERPVAIDVGKFGTPVGLEDNEALTNWSYSRSLLYTWAEPSLHTGLRLSCKVTDTLDASVFWVNGWNSVFLDGSTMRTFAGAITWRPTASVEISLVDMAGLEHPPTQLSAPLAFRNVFDASVAFEVTERLTLASSADYGVDRSAGGVAFWGLSAYARARALPWLWTTLRGEYFADASGFTTGTAQEVAEGTATVELRHDVERLRFITRVEYRHDRSTARPFDAALPASRGVQDTLTVAGLLAF